MVFSSLTSLFSAAGRSKRQPIQNETHLPPMNIIHCWGWICKKNAIAANSDLVDFALAGRAIGAYTLGFIWIIGV
jgi:hypothetical protein